MAASLRLILREQSLRRALKSCYADPIGKIGSFLVRLRD